MGYYSEVALVLDKEAKELFDRGVNRLDEIKKKEFIKFLDETCEIHTLDNCYLYYWNSIKWYASTPEIATIKQIINILEVKGSEELLEFYYINIGEECNDITIAGDFYTNPFNVKLVQEIQFNTEKVKNNINQKEEIKLDEFKGKAVEIFIDYFKNEYDREYKPHDMEILYANSNTLYEQALIVLYEQDDENLYQISRTLGANEYHIITFKNSQSKLINFIGD